MGKKCCDGYVQGKQATHRIKILDKDSALVSKQANEIKDILDDYGLKGERKFSDHWCMCRELDNDICYIYIRCESTDEYDVMVHALKIGGCAEELPLDLDKHREFINKIR